MTLSDIALTGPGPDAISYAMKTRICTLLWPANTGYRAWMPAGALCVLLGAMPAAGDDTELFVNDTRRFPNSRPNVLFIMDTSGSMTTLVETRSRYNPAVRYPGRCDPARVYWRTGRGDPPACSSSRWFERTALVCRSGLDAFARGVGHYTNRFAQYDAATDTRWERLDAAGKTRLVECENDGGLHGNGVDRLAVYARDADDGRPWSADPRDEVGWGQNPTDRLYTVYDGNYLNWFHSPPDTSLPRLQVLKDAATALLSRMDGVNVGLMRLNIDQGGTVIFPLANIATARAGIIDSVNALTAEGWSPLAEALYEAHQYYSGGNVHYGDRQGPQRSVPGARDPASGGRAYESPLQLSCQKNFIVLLTDGAPTLDVDADDRISALRGFSALVGPRCDGTVDGACLDDIAAYLFSADLNPDLAGQQNVVTYAVGFTADLPILESTAARGGGAYFTTDNSATLASVLSDIAISIRDTETTFTSATVPVNAFNRLRHHDELYLAIFRASDAARWPGNLKKYRLRATDGAILDAAGRLAIDPVSRWFAPDSRSFWSSAADGANVALGGAAGRIPDPTSRGVYTYLGNPLLTHPGNAVHRANPSIDAALLGIGDPGDPARDELVDVIRGMNVAGGRNGNPGNRMGDPLHGKPALITYGGTSGNPDPADQAIYLATNDGYLHAIDARTGNERWTFVPPEFIGDQSLLHANDAYRGKHYGIDGNVSAYLHADGDGVIEPDEAERVYLFFGMRRGGSSYYGLDVTRVDSPQVLWRMDRTSLPGVGQTWSTPMPTRIEIQDTVQNALNLVLVFGGGYDTSQDQPPGSTDRSGNALFIVDALTGNLLWHASQANSNFDSTDMAYSIPADVRVIDLDRDGFADRFYAADMGGQVWRFDVFNGQPAERLIAGGVIAQLGGAPRPAPDARETRRFYSAPDVALVNTRAHQFMHIGVGSGHRARPNSPHTQDRFHALRDYAAFKHLTESDYAAMTPIAPADLVDITDNLGQTIPPGSPGWRLDLGEGGWRGEKALAESRTFNNRIFLTTFIPGTNAEDSSDPCAPPPGTNRLYVLDLLNGDPVRNFDGSAEDAELTASDRFQEFPGSIASEPAFIFPAADDPDCAGAECVPPPLVCVGLLCLPTGFDNAPVRTYWSQEGVQ